MAAGAHATTAWDLATLLDTADPRAELPARHLWLARVLEGLRQPGDAAHEEPAPVQRLRMLLDRLERDPAQRAAVRGVLAAFWREIDAAALFADFGFSHRQALAGELWQRLRERLLPATPATADLAALFPLLLRSDDAAWLEAIDAATLERLGALVAPGDDAPGWRAWALDGVTILVTALRAAGFSPALRTRMDPALLADEPFRQLAQAADTLREAVREGRDDDALRAASYLRVLLEQCRRAVDSIADHLETHGVSMDIVFETEQAHGRARRIGLLLDAVVAAEPARELQRLTVSLLHTLAERRGLRAGIALHGAQLARKIVERSAETGEHYIARTPAEYRETVARAALGGTVMAGTTFVKFAIGALALSAFWGGWWAGLNYAASFVAIMLLHGTVATKQPAMTAPALAARLAEVQRGRSEEAFVDEVAHLLRSQVAGIVGNLAACGPIVLALQLGATALGGAPLVGTAEADHVLDALTLLGPTLLFAAFTGVLLFASSLVAGWTENWFVFHRLDSAIAWNPRIVARLGTARARGWAAWWRRHVSGVAANVSLGLMLGLVPALASFFGLPLEVRHVTLSTGQLAAAAGAMGTAVLDDPRFWWALAAIPLTAAANVGVSFWLAFKLALRARDTRIGDRRRLAVALRRRLRRRPLSFLWPRAAP